MINRVINRLTSPKEITFYFIGGLSGSVINLAITYLLVSIAGLYYVWGMTISSLCNLTYNFLFHRSITFGAKDKIIRRAVTYYLLGTALFFITLGTAIFLKAILGINYLMAQLLALTTSIIINFFGSKYIVFAKTAAENNHKLQK